MANTYPELRIKRRLKTVTLQIDRIHQECLRYNFIDEFATTGQILVFLKALRVEFEKKKILANQRRRRQKIRVATRVADTPPKRTSDDL